MDPPLTHLGVSQAHICGKRLDKFLEDEEYDRVKIECSPFIRCMETAAAIAKEIGIKRVKINYRCAEWLSDRLYPDGTPLNKLEISENKIQE